MKILPVTVCYVYVAVPVVEKQTVKKLELFIAGSSGLKLIYCYCSSQ